MRLVILFMFTLFTRSSVAGLSQLYPPTNSADPQQAAQQLTKEDFHILFQLISLVKKMGGVSALESLLINSARNNYRSPGPVLSNHRTLISDIYGPTVTELTVTSPPLSLRKESAPLVLTNFTINIQKLNIDPYALKEED
ncbi:uncharacterized protein LOC128983460 [Macrosteles quadrilineatus]|uniref:uncharacterized protein LOC128983460 n=1 Tax=Macrosteles quadrilineatus TaxID=74068 RepID=UPI0023E10CB1|nr:uncharacterized protein LOC128983460 [Macrosteles quadrilineatus]